MRKPIALVLTTAILAVAAACGGGGGDTPAGQSGEAPIVVEEATTTTEAVVTEDTLPEREVEIPDTTETGLTWDAPPMVDESTGSVNMYDFNRLLVEATDLTALVPKAEFEALGDGDELEAALADATLEAPAKAVALFLGLEPGDANTQILLSNVGGPEGWRVTVIQIQEDDSVRAVRWEFTIQVQPRGEIDRENQEVEGTTDTTAAAEGTETTVAPETTTTLVPPTPDLVPVLYTGERTQQCQPDRGHQDFTVAPCV